MDHLIDSYKERLGLEGAHFTRIEHDDAFVAVVYKVTLPDGGELILKICPRPHHYLREEYFLSMLQGVIPVPRVIRLIQEEKDLKGAILMECLPGRPLKNTDIDEPIGYEMGEWIARVHLCRVSGYGDLLDERHLMETPRAQFIAKFEEGLEECSTFFSPSLLKRLEGYMRGHLTLLDNVDGPCIVHRDFRPGNLLIHEGKLTGVLDWAGGRGSFAEEDFCSLEHGEWGISALAKSAFLKGYASVRPLPKYDAIMPLLRINRVVAMTGLMVRAGALKARDRATYERNHTFLEQMTHTMRVS